MAEEATSFEQTLPKWITQEAYEVLPAIDTVLLGSQRNLAITKQGLARFGGQINSPDELLRFTAQRYLKGSPIAANIISSCENPNLVIKHDVSRNSVNNLLIVSAVGRLIPLETEDYIFKPLEIYWAFDQPNGSMIAMIRVDPVSLSGQDNNRKYVQARARVIEESKKVGMSISPLPYQDLVYLGNNEIGKPIVTLLEENSPQSNIIELLSK